MTPATSWRLSLKYAIDRFLAIVALVVGSPLLALLAVRIKLEDHGPILFRQPRIGAGRNPFEVVKFRSMVPNADHLLDETGRAAAQPRITRCGQWMRRWGLDELPQLINIAKGDMSFIGPRPMLPEMASRLTASQARRFLVRPGITGPAQVAGRNTLAWSRRLDMDVEYATSYSLMRDIRILGNTLVVVMTGRGFVEDRNPDQVDDLARNL